MEVLLVLLGVLIGSVATIMYFASVSIGTLRVDRSDPTEPPYLFLEIDADKSVDTITKQKRVLFRVVKKNYISENN